MKISFKILGFNSLTYHAAIKSNKKYIYKQDYATREIVNSLGTGE